MDVILLDELSEKIDSIGTLVDTNNTANATGTVSQKLTYIASSLIGTTAQTGGTSTTGTVMAKLNTLLEANINHGSYTKTSAGTYTWTCPKGVYQVVAIGMGGTGGGGGGAGGGYQQGTYFAPGGSGAVPHVISLIISVVPGTTYTLTVGTGGSGGSGGGVSNYSEFKAGTAGSSGGATKFGSLFTWNGGAGGGAGTTASYIGGAGGAVSNVPVGNIFYVDLGKSGETGEQTDMNGEGYGSAHGGGAAKTNSYGYSSGAGGGGAKVKDGYGYQCYTSGKDGTGGAAGFIKIIW